MRKRLASKPAQPRSWVSLPGYPTLAAAGLSLCLAGCGAGGWFANEPKLAGGAPTPYGADAAPAADTLPPPSAPDTGAMDTGAMIDSESDGGAVASDATSAILDPSNMAGGEPYLFIPDAGSD